MSARQRVPALALRALCAASGPATAAASAAAAKLAPAVFLSPAPGARFFWTQHLRLAGTGSSSISFRSFAAPAALPPHTELLMPALSPTMSQGNIISWKKKEGDEVQPGDVYCEVETDKATIEWEAQEEGYLAKILVPEGTNGIDVGRPVAIIVEEADDLAAFADYTPGSPLVTPAAAELADKTAAPAASSGGSFPAHEVLAMPALSPTMAQGTILSWKKKAGDEVQPGDVYAEVETDKATIEWEAQEEGVVAKILVPEGANMVDVGAPVLVIVDDKDDVPAFESYTAADAGGKSAPAPLTPVPAGSDAAKAAPKAEPAPTAVRPSAPAAAPGSRIVASPYARKLAAEAGVSLSGVGGSGPNGRIVAADVHQLVASGGGAAPTAAAAALGGAFTDVTATQMRKVIAARLLESKQQIPHYYLTVSCRLDKLNATRQQLNAALAATGGKLSVNDFVLKASALALRRVPEANASWHGDFIRQYHTVDCCVAVQTPGGLITPIVRNADAKGLAAISAEIKELAARAREGGLTPEEYSGGTFTLSNLGMMGVSSFAAIVNPPQACILAVGAAEGKVVPASGGGFEEGTFMTVTLSCDHRVIDGAVGAQWLQAFKGYVEEPASMLL